MACDHCGATSAPFQDGTRITARVAGTLYHGVVVDPFEVYCDCPETSFAYRLYRTVKTDNLDCDGNNLTVFAKISELTLDTDHLSG